MPAMPHGMPAGHHPERTALEQTDAARVRNEGRIGHLFKAAGRPWKGCLPSVFCPLRIDQWKHQSGCRAFLES